MAGQRSRTSVARMAGGSGGGRRGAGRAAQCHPHSDAAARGGVRGRVARGSAQAGRCKGSSAAIVAVRRASPRNAAVAPLANALRQPAALTQRHDAHHARGSRSRPEELGRAARCPCPFGGAAPCSSRSKEPARDVLHLWRVAGNGGGALPRHVHRTPRHQPSGSPSPGVCGTGVACSARLPRSRRGDALPRRHSPQMPPRGTRAASMAQRCRLSLQSDRLVRYHAGPLPAPTAAASYSIVAQGACIGQVRPLATARG